MSGRKTRRTRIARAAMGPLALAVAAFAALPAHASDPDVALLHVVELDVGSLVAEGIERHILSDLSRPDDPRVMNRSEASEKLLRGESAEGLVDRATARLTGLREQLAASAAGPEMVDAADEARELLLRALVVRPRLDGVREAWALRGLASHQLGEIEAARRDFARVLESEPSFRPDPRLFSPAAREEMGRALMARTESNWRVIPAADAATLGRRLGVGYVVMAHLYDTGLAELAYRVDVFDVASGRFVDEVEIHFPDAAAERERVAGEIAALIRAAVPRSVASARGPVEPEWRAEPRERTPDPVRPRDTEPRPTHEPRPEPIARPSGPFDVPGAEPEVAKARSGRGWWVAGAVVAVAAGGAAVWLGLNADPGQADLVVRTHRRAAAD